MKKLRAMVQIDVTLTDEEWEQIQTDYAYCWRDEIKDGDVPKDAGAADAWVHMLQNDDCPGDIEIDWEATTDEEIVDDE